MKLLRWLRRWWWVAVLGVAAAALVTVCVRLYGLGDWLEACWCWLTKGESGSTTIRNVGLVIAGIVAMVLTLKRIRVADRQAETAQKGLLHDRYQKSAEMLGGRLPAVRLGGIFALRQLATEHPEPFLPLAVRQYCAFVRRPFESNGEEIGGNSPAREGGAEGLREDVRAAMESIVLFRSDPKTRKEVMGLTLDLSGANLSDADLSRAILSNANLSKAVLVSADLSGAELCGANVSNADLSATNLSNADLSGAVLSGAETLSAGLPATDQGPVRRLTQDQLDRACANPGDPPALRGALSPDGSPLTWRGPPCSAADD